MTRPSEVSAAVSGSSTDATPGSHAVVLAVDGGNSKTDLALVRADGAVLAFVRGPLGSPHHIGLQGSVHLLATLFDDAIHVSGLERSDGPVARVAHLMLAGLDFPEEERRLEEAVSGLGWASRIVVGNDTFAVLRAGTDRGWGVAVTCGTGINCIGIGPDGRQVRFPSLGATTGDWGGGYDLGVAALGAAARSQDGRGPTTSLQHVVPEHFGLRTPVDVAEAIHTGVVPERRLVELAPLVFRIAPRDEVAAALVARLADEVVAFIRTTIERLELGGMRPEVLLGGGLMQASDRTLVQATTSRLRSLGMDVSVRAVTSPPIVGAALLGLDALGADEHAHARARQELGAAAAEVGGAGDAGSGSDGSAAAGSDGSATAGREVGSAAGSDGSTAAGRELSSAAGGSSAAESASGRDATRGSRRSTSSG